VTGRRVPVLRDAEMGSTAEAVLRGYMDFARLGPEPGAADPAKAFAAHHAACKAALAHLDALVKVLRSLDATASEVEEPHSMLVEARAAIAQLPEEDADAGEQE
jgi:hypothetical protein